MTEWSCSGLQLRQRRFDSDSRLHLFPSALQLTLEARVVELVDTGDLKSPDRKIVPVQVRPRAPVVYI